jgi:hypothetical protein
MIKGNEKHINIGGKDYVLTIKRSMLISLAKVVPELIKINRLAGNASEEELAELQFAAGASIYDNIDVIFHEMIKIRHKDITKEKSDEIYLQFCDEYEDVDEKILDFFLETFTGGVPKENKKKINW